LLIGDTSSAFAGNISYAYDAGGRLICVFDNTAGHGVNYNYDPVGNVTSITTATGCAQNTMRIKNKASALAKNSSPPAMKRASTKAVVVNSAATTRVVSKAADSGKASPGPRERTMSKKALVLEKLIAASVR
jgi:hypothetical protein